MQNALDAVDNVHHGHCHRKVFRSVWQVSVSNPAYTRYNMIIDLLHWLRNLNPTSWPLPRLGRISLCPSFLRSVLQIWSSILNMGLGPIVLSTIATSNYHTYRVQVAGLSHKQVMALGAQGILIHQPVTTTDLLQVMMCECFSLTAFTILFVSTCNTPGRVSRITCHWDGNVYML